jgi:hypothetical protein
LRGEERERGSYTELSAAIELYRAMEITFCLLQAEAMLAEAVESREEPRLSSI